MQSTLKPNFGIDAESTVNCSVLMLPPVFDGDVVGHMLARY